MTKGKKGVRPGKEKPRKTRQAQHPADSPARSESSQILSLHQEVGNTGVRRLIENLGDQRTGNHTAINVHQVMRQGLLTRAEEDSAISYTRARYDERSIKIIQNLAGVGVDGDFGRGSAEGVADFQDTNDPLAVDGKVGPNTLGVILPGRIPAHRPEHAIQLVADFYNLDTTSETLSVHFDPGLAVDSEVSFESGNMRVVRIGRSAFTSAEAMRDAIQAGLSEPAPAIAPAGPRPAHLTRAEERAATRINRSRFTDPRSIHIIQGLVDSNPDGDFGPDTAERVAEYQDISSLTTVNGQVGEETLREMVDDLDILGEQNAAIRLIIDFYNMPEHDALLDIFFDPSVPSNARTRGNNPGPSLVRIGPAGFAQGFEGLVHTIAHELEHVRQRNEGIQNSDVREFLGEAIEIMSVGMPEEGLGGFMDDARRALNRFNQLSDEEKREHWERFEEVRDKVQERFNLASAADQATHQGTMDNYNGVAEPPAAAP